jgi:hypothetical protein
LRSTALALASLLVCSSCGGGGGGRSVPAIGFSEPVVVALHGTLAVQPPVLGHFDADGHLDVAIPSLSDPRVDIGLGLGDGTFDFLAPLTAGVPGGSVELVRTAHLNLDAHTDLVVASREEGLLQTFLGNGDGTFDPVFASPVAFVDDVEDIQVGRLDADVFDDVVLASGDFAWILRSFGDGGFVAPLGMLATPGGDRLMLADGLGTDALDVFACSGSTNAIYVFSGNGDGTFAPSAPIAVAEGPAGIAEIAPNFGDFLFAVTTAAPVGVRLYSGPGDGSFTPAPQGFLPLPGLFAGTPSVARDGPLPWAVVVPTNEADQTFFSRLRLSLPTTDVEVVTEAIAGGVTVGPTAGDLDGDGSDDLVHASVGDSLGSLLFVRFGP